MGRVRVRVTPPQALCEGILEERSLVLRGAPRPIGVGAVVLGYAIYMEGAMGYKRDYPQWRGVFHSFGAVIHRGGGTRGRRIKP